MIQLLFKPFEKYSEAKILTFGITATVFGLIIGFYFNARFDGVLDVHFAKEVSIIESLKDFIIVLFCLTFSLFNISKYLNRKTRFIDVLSVSIVARVPIYLLSIFNFNDSMSSISEKLLEQLAQGKGGLSGISGAEIVLLLISGIVSLIFTIWYVSLLFNGYKVASNAKGGKAIVLFSISIILAEILSKVLVYFFN